MQTVKQDSEAEPYGANPKGVKAGLVFNAFSKATHHDDAAANLALVAPRRVKAEELGDPVRDFALELGAGRRAKPVEPVSYRVSASNFLWPFNNSDLPRVADRASVHIGKDAFVVGLATETLACKYARIHTQWRKKKGRTLAGK